MAGRRDDLQCRVMALRFLCLGPAVLSLVVVIAALNCAVASGLPEPANPDKQTIDSGAPVPFDIPAQPLASALDAYSVTAHREVLYNGELAVGQKSTRVMGYFTPAVALRILLEGTGLLPRYMAADAFVLVVDEEPLVPANTAPPDVVMRYYGRIQASLKQAFCANRSTRPGDYSVAVGFRIGSSGTVSRAELLGSTGDHDLDLLIANTVRGLVIGAPPPQGFAQPVILRVAPQSEAAVRDCDAATLQLSGAHHD